LKYPVSEVISFQNSICQTKSRNPLISIFSAQMLHLTPIYCLFQEKRFFLEVLRRLSKPNIFVLNNFWDVVASKCNLLEQVNLANVFCLNTCIVVSSSYISSI